MSTCGKSCMFKEQHDEVKIQRKRIKEFKKTIIIDKEFTIEGANK